MTKTEQHSSPDPSQETVYAYTHKQADGTGCSAHTRVTRYNDIFYKLTSFNYPSGKYSHTLLPAGLFHAVSNDALERYSQEGEKGV